MKKNGLVYSAIVLSFSNAGLQFLGFIYRMVMARFAGAEGLGVYHLVFVVYIVVNSVCLSGVTMAITRLSAENQLSKNSVVALAKFSIKVFLCIFSIVATIVVCFNKQIAELILGNSETGVALKMMLVCLFLTGFENIAKAIFIGVQKVKYTAISEICEQIVRIIAVGLLLSKFAYNNSQIALLIMLGMSISEVVSVVFLWTSFHKNFGFNSHGVKFDNKFVFLKTAIPLSIAALATNIISSASSVILPKRLVHAGFTDSQALSMLGIISSVAAPIMVLPVALVAALSTNLVPAISARSSKALKEKLIVKAYKTTGLIGIPATAALIPIAPAIGRVFFNQDIDSTIFVILAVHTVFIYYQMISCSILNSLGKQSNIMAINVTSEIIQLILTYIWAGKIHIYGYLLAALISSIISSTWSFCLIKKRTKISVLHMLLEPTVCGILVYLWVRVFYYFFILVAGSQLKTMIFSILSAGLLYFTLLDILGVNVIRLVKGEEQKRKKFNNYLDNMF